MSAAWEFAFIGGTVDVSLPTKAAVSLKETLIT